MNTIHGFVLSIVAQENGTERITVVLNNDKTVRLNVPAGIIDCSQRISLGFDPDARSYSYPPPA